MMMRLLDITIALLGLIFLSPILVIISLLIKLNSPGPVFYRAQRVGKGGHPFYLIKFRSMVEKADKLGPEITPANDSRVTSIGRFLRNTKVDELPQLINVLKGEMSLVGPRPEDPRYVALYDREQRRLLDVRPGITSAASIEFRNEEQLLTGADWEKIYCSKVLPAKSAIDLEYLSQRSVRSDIFILFRTVLAIFNIYL